MTIRAAIYARASADCPVSTESQIEKLKAVAAEHGWVVVQTFSDRSTSVKQAREKRPAETALVDAIRANDIQRVLSYGVDRIGKSLADFVGFLGTCQKAGVALWLDEQNLDTATSNGLSLYEVATLMAYHQRQARRDRILRGQAAARAASVRFGRPPLGQAKVEKAKRALAAGNGVRQAARAAGISAASVSRLKSSASGQFG